jgi:conjugal transfer mating pair stabilization protein TraN
MKEHDCEQWIEAKKVDGKIVTEMVTGTCDLKGTCEVMEQTCIEGPETRTIDGVQVYQACWRWNIHYGCKEGEDTSCEELYARPECEMTSEECIDETEADPNKPRSWDGQCDVVQRTFSCLATEAYKKEYTDCRTTKLCTQHNENFRSCFDTTTPRDKDFVKAMVATEISRQAGAYVNQDSQTIYDTGDNRCTIDFGFKNCCKPNSGGENFTNSTTMGLTIELAGQAVKIGAKYVFDALLAKSSMSFLGGGIAANMGLAPLNTAVATLNSVLAPYGISIGIGLPVSGSFVMVGSYMVTFNQIALIYTIAKFLYNYLMVCDSDSQITDMLLGQNLCHYVGSYCSRRILGVCIQTTQTYCCSNGRLGLAINEQGRAQIGKSWGEPNNPQCSGFTTSEFAKLDFEQMDLKGFEEEMQNTVQYPNADSIRSAIAGKISSGEFKNPYDPVKKGPTNVSESSYYNR